MDRLSDAQVLLLAAQYTATPDLTRLRALAASRSDVLDIAIVHRILYTYLPLESEHDIQAQLTAFLQDLHEHNLSTLDAETQEDLGLDWNDVEAEDALHSFALEKVPRYETSDSKNPLSDFVIAWIHKIEEFGGLSETAIDFANQLSSKHDALREWAETYLQPLYKLQQEYNTGAAQSLSLRDIEDLEGEPGVAILLDSAAHSQDKSHLAQDLDQVVTPWVKGSKATKRRRLSPVEPDQNELRPATSWSDVNQWLFLHAKNNFEAVAQTVESWDGPAASTEQSDATSDFEDSIAYIRTILAIIYVVDDEDRQGNIQRKQSLLQRAARLAQLMPPEFDSVLPEIPSFSISSSANRSGLFDNQALASTNGLTKPSTDVVDFLHGILSTQALLNIFKIERTTRAVVSTTLFDGEDKQKDELRTILNQIPRLTRSNVSWSEIRNQIHWLRSWSTAINDERIAFLGQLTKDYLELQLLDAILTAGDYQAVKDIYVQSDEQILPEEQIQKRIVGAIHDSYDNASNGNRTRGGVKKAANCIVAFRSSFTDNTEFEQLEHLIKATHSLSFYHLTLQHGVPFQPVSIRVSSDPVSMIEKVLERNENAYTKLDDLLSIGRNFVLAGLPILEPPDLAPGEPVPIDRRLFDVEHRITFAAIEAALAVNDFDTAYSLITTRLNTSAHKAQDSAYTDDTSWRAAYAAGKHRPRASTSPNIHSQISSLQKRMELLSTALMLAPSAELYEILTTWQELEAELDSLKSQALQEERAVEAQSDQMLPGGFGPSDRDLDANETRRMLDSRKSYNATGPSYEEEAPMGLFDVAKGVGSALGRHAFPLRGMQGQGMKVRDVQGRSSTDELRTSQEISRPGSADGQQRQRKRDMISNAVTGGLVSGMSWVLGAPAPRQQGQRP